MAKVNWKVILILIIAIVIVVIALAVILGRSGTQTIPETTPTNGTKCKMEDDTTGVCVAYDQCISTHSLMDKSMIRSYPHSGCASGQWCCPEILLNREGKIFIDTRFQKPDIACTPLLSDTCPWCVTLHRVQDKSEMDQEAFCMGSLIRPNIILTAATCLAASEKYNAIFARAPASTKKLKKYYAKMRLPNPYYNSGTHVNDFGLIVLYESVEWGNKEPPLACLNYEEINGDCVTFGLDGNDQIASTIIEPTEEKCNAFGGGESLEVKCGKNMDDSYCFAAVGAPVVCQTEKSANNEAGGVLMGVLRSNCVKDEILLGQLAGSIMWLNPILPYLTEK